MLRRGERREIKRERKRENVGLFCAICASQIEREIAMCCWRASVINLVSKWRDGDGERERERRTGGRQLVVRRTEIFCNSKSQK